MKLRRKVEAHPVCPRLERRGMACHGTVGTHKCNRPPQDLALWEGPWHGMAIRLCTSHPQCADTKVPLCELGVTGFVDEGQDEKARLPAMTRE
jgi:hypothetical protein